MLWKVEHVLLQVNIPPNAWAGTIANLTLATSSDGFDIEYDVKLQIEVLEIRVGKSTYLIRP